MKQLDPVQKKIGSNDFFIKPFPAFTAAKLSGELAALVAPLIGSLAPAFGGESEETDLMNVEVEKVMPNIGNAFSSLSGDKFERLMKELLITNRNVSVEGPDTDGEVKLLTYDLANEVFCGEVQDMYILCFEVIRLNFNGFFKKLGDRFGNLKGLLANREVPSSKNTEN